MNRLKELRREKRLTLRELADKLHMTNSNISMMELGQRGISNENLVAFCNFFDVSSDYLLGLSDQRKPIPEKKQQPLNDFQFALHNLDGELTADDKETILKLAKTLAEKNK